MKYIKPYLIYNNNQLKDLILKMPKNKDELKLVAGFGEIKVNKYGVFVNRKLGQKTIQF